MKDAEEFVEIIVEGLLGRFDEVLTHKEWVELRCLLMKGLLLLLQTINEALTEQTAQAR